MEKMTRDLQLFADGGDEAGKGGTAVMVAAKRPLLKPKSMRCLHERRNKVRTCLRALGIKDVDEVCRNKCNNKDNC